MAYKTKWFNLYLSEQEKQLKNSEEKINNSIKSNEIEITEKKIHKKRESKGIFNKNYTFQNNSEAKKIISGLNNNENPNTNNSQNFHTRASLGIEIQSQLFTDQENKKQDKYMKEVLIIGNISESKTEESNLFEIGDKESCSKESKKSPKFVESQHSEQNIIVPNEEGISFKVNSQEDWIEGIQSDRAEKIQSDRIQDKRDSLMKKNKSENLNNSLDDFAYLETEIQNESKKIELFNENPSFYSNEPKESMDFEKHFLGEENKLDKFWDEPEKEPEPVQKAKLYKNKKKNDKKEEDNFSMMSEMSINSGIQKNLQKAKEMTMQEGLSHLQLEDIIGINTMQLSMKSDKAIQPPNRDFQYDIQGHYEEDLEDK